MTSGEERARHAREPGVGVPRRPPADQLALLGSDGSTADMLHEIEIDTADDLGDN
jgi:hypothetical protein